MEKDVKVPNDAIRNVDNAVILLVRLPDMQVSLSLHMMEKGEFLHPETAYLLDAPTARGLAAHLLERADEIESLGTPESFRSPIN